MKKIVLFIIVLLSAGIGYAQSAQPVDWETYSEKYIGNTAFDYISHSYGRSTDTRKYFCYFKKNGKPVVAYFENLLLVKETSFDNLDLFDIVKQNLPALKKIRNNYSKYYTRDKMPEKQLGIRFGSLHFNHYGNKDAAFINGLKNQKLKDGFTAINLLIEAIEKE